MLNEWTMVVAQLAEWSLPTPEICGSNSVIGKISSDHLFTFNYIEETKKDKRDREWSIFQKC